LNIVAPDLLVLGRKDFQQFVILKKMIEDLRMQVVVIAGATQRHADGLAISSRNRYLDANERTHAPVLHAVLAGASKAIHAGRTDYAAIESQARADLKAAGLRADYVEVRHADSLGKPNGAHAPSELIVLAAAWLGNARLIDNVQVDV
jgi:pantoate--beta-alanine ligase